MRRSKEGMRKAMDGYFKNTCFTEYKDMQEPIIGCSDDGSLAWSVVKVRVAGRRKTDDGSMRNFDAIFAWITVYERKNGRWIRSVEVSTDDYGNRNSGQTASSRADTHHMIQKNKVAAPIKAFIPQSLPLKI